ncbi:hypothetical protein BC629DRAFT_582737 [Irpex lacteus]|nr:hypothetical protein BC629DRAFT_582737 [Irpex lacteus]
MRPLGCLGGPCLHREGKGPVTRRDLWDTRGLPRPLPVITLSHVTSLYLNALTPEATVLASHHISSWRRQLREIRVFCTAGVTTTDLTNSILDFPLRSCSELRILEISLPDESLICSAQRLTSFWSGLPQPIEQVTFVFPPQAVCALVGGQGSIQFDCAHLPNLACVTIVAYKETHAQRLRRRISFNNALNIHLVGQMSALPEEYHEAVALRGHAWAADICR